MLSCSYYQAHVLKSKTWLFVAIMRSFEHCCFDRTFDKQQGIFEFFVPAQLEPDFIHIMNYFQDQAIVHSFHKLPNRLLDPLQTV